MSKEPSDPDRLRTLLREWSAVPAPDAGLAESLRRDLAAPRRTEIAGLSWRLAVATLAIGGLLGSSALGLTEKLEEKRTQPAMPDRYLAWIAPHLSNQTAAR